MPPPHRHKKRAHAHSHTNSDACTYVVAYFCDITLIEIGKNKLCRLICTELEQNWAEKQQQITLNTQTDTHTHINQIRMPVDFYLMTAQVFYLYFVWLSVLCLYTFFLFSLLFIYKFYRKFFFVYVSLFSVWFVLTLLDLFNNNTLVTLTKIHHLSYHRFNFIMHIKYKHKQWKNWYMRCVSAIERLYDDRRRNRLSNGSHGVYQWTNIPIDM